MVEESISSVPGATLAITPCAPVWTSRTCSPAGSMVITASAPAQASATEVAAAPPAALKRPTDAFATSKPVTACPALRRFCAIGNPMLPSPMNPIRAMFSSFPFPSW